MIRLMLALSLAVVTAAQASEVAIPNVFNPNTPAIAAEVNENFSALEAAVNDNDARLNNLAPANPSSIVQLSTASSPTSPGNTASLSLRLNPAGGVTDFIIPAGYVFVLTDVIVSAPRSNAPQARHVAAICDTPCTNTRISLQLDTRVDGFQKEISLRRGPVFKTIPQFLTLASNPSDLSIFAYGYLAPDE